MRRIPNILVIDFFFLIICGFGVYRLAEKAGFPADLGETKGFLIIKEVSLKAFSVLREGDTVFSLSGQRIHSEFEVEFLCDEYAIGSAVITEISRSGHRESVAVSLEQYYSKTSVIIETFAGAVFYFLGMFVALKRPKDRSALTFHNLSVSICALILLTSGRFTINPHWLGYGLELLFYISYSFVPVYFVEFITVFPRELQIRKKLKISLYSIAGILSIWTSISFLSIALPSVRLENFTEYLYPFIAIKIFFAILFFAGLFIIFRSYRSSKEDFERKKLRWIFFGIAFGACDYIFLDLIPQIVTGSSPVHEDIIIGLSIIAPISFAIAIIRYRIFDIDLLIQRTSGYAIVIGMMMLVYLGIVAALSSIIQTSVFSSTVINVTSAVVIMLLFGPMQKIFIKLIDKRFFRVSYNFHEVQRSFFEEIKFVTTKIDLANLVTERILTLIPVTKIGFFVVETPSDALRLLAHRNFDMLERRKVMLEKGSLKTGLELPVALIEKVESGTLFEAADPIVFRRWGIALALPMLSLDRSILGFLVLGGKLSGSRFSMEDISLLNSVSIQSGLALERQSILVALLLEQAESERLTELNTLKSYFVSAVSHDLKTPLTSIRLFAELLKDKKDITSEKRNEYLGIIEGEADRLSRLIGNVLDFAKVEKGTKDYRLKHIDLNVVANDVIRSLAYQIHSNGFHIYTSFDSASLTIEGDADAIFDVLVNLITNGMKYSPADRKNLRITTSAENRFALLQVEDEGYGIASGEIEHIFEPFYRIKNNVMKSVGGAGLGLSLVKHTMEGHNGRVEAKSEVGKGSIFALYFPLITS